MRLEGKKILLGITGSIAAYKSASLARLLIKQGADVKVIMTDAAKEFISELTLSVLTKHRVESELFTNGAWNNHVELGLWADLMIIAPCTATSLSKMANGLADNMLVASYLSAKCPVYIAPAMDLDMWIHPSTVSNLKLLQSYGNTIIDVDHGELASGLHGKGRMAEPEDITEVLIRNLNKQQDLVGQKVLVTAGPTYEHLDPVRFIGNKSTGKMGIAIVNELQSRGAEVHLVLGPSNLLPISKKVNVYPVTSAQEMYDKSHTLFPNMDIAILAAAVADYRPKEVADKKIKKNSDNMSLSLIKNPDIAKTLGAIKNKMQKTIGFALETNNALANAKSKVERKNFDFIVLNSLEDKGAGFGVDTNKVSFIFKDGKVKGFDLKPKTMVAKDIVDELINL